MDSLLGDDYLARESHDGSMYEEVRPDAEQSDFSDSSDELVDPFEPLDGPVDGIAPFRSEELKTGSKSSKKESKKKKKNKSQKTIGDLASPEAM